MSSPPAPGNAARRTPGLYLILIVGSVALYVLLHRSLSTIRFCCDSEYYAQTIDAMKTQGFAAPHAALGYRSYLFPYVFSLLPVDYTRVLNAAQPLVVYSPGYTLASSILFYAAFVVYLLIVPNGKPKLALCLAYFLNPFVLTYVPYPLQESFTVILGAWLIGPWVYSLKKDNHALSLVLVWTTFSSLYMTRPTYLLLLPGALILTFHLVHRLVKESSRRSLAAACVLSSAAGLAIIGPQSYTILKRLGSLNPYPNIVMLGFQVRMGTENIKYATNIGPAAPSMGVLYKNPFRDPDDRSDLSYYAKDPFRAIVVGLLHIYNAINHDTYQIFIRDRQLGIVSSASVLSSIYLFLGAAFLLERFFTRSWSVVDLAAVVSLSLLMGCLSVLVSESRFGIFVLVVCSMYAWSGMLEGGRRRRESLAALVSIVLIVTVLSIMLNAMVLASSTFRAG